LGYHTLYRVSAALLLVAGLGHTFGGMLGTARRGPAVGSEAAQVFSAMKSVHFVWRGADCTWFGFWLGNGLSVSALMLLAIVVLWVLGGLGLGLQRATMPIAWTALLSLLLLSTLGFKYFGARVGAAFGLVALLTGIAVIMSTVAVGSQLGTHS
jgi:hypothetical protein